MVNNLFANISDVKLHIGGTVNKNLSLDAMKVFLSSASETFIIPKIGRAQFDFLVQDTPSPALTAKQLIALGVLKSAIAWFAIYEYVQVGDVQLSDAGLVRVEGEHTRTAYKYQTQNYRRNCLRQGWQQIEQLLEIFDQNASDFTLYEASEECANNNRHLLRYAKDFERCSSRRLDRVTYEFLLSYIEDVEEFWVRENLGAALWTRLLAKAYDTSANAYEKQIIRLLRKGVADFSQSTELVGSLLQVTEGRTVITEKSRDDDSFNEAAPRADLLNATFNQKRNWAEKYFARANDYLRANPSVFPEWQGFLPLPVEINETDDENDEAQNIPVFPYYNYLYGQPLLPTIPGARLKML